MQYVLAKPVALNQPTLAAPSSSKQDKHKERMKSDIYENGTSELLQNMLLVNNPGSASIHHSQ